MAATNDKARYYLEQTVPELQEYSRKQLFTPAEISSINARRTAFEHLANSRIGPGGCSPELYGRYIAYEKTLDALRRKRVRRLGVTQRQHTHSGQRRIFGLYERAVKKFPGALELWRDYVEYTAGCKAYRKVEELFTRCLRLHPTKHALWAWAAEWTFETQGDMSGARGYMQRGVRFCEGTGEMWVEYARLEMRYVDKIERRRKVLGLDDGDDPQTTIDGLEGAERTMDDATKLSLLADDDPDAELIKDTSATELELRKLSASPFLAGGIPLAIFDAAMKKFKNDSRWDELAWQFFDAFADHSQTSCCKNVLEHVLDAMRKGKPNTMATAICTLKLSCVTIPHISPEFPSAFGAGLQAVSQLKQDRSFVLSEHIVKILLPITLEEDLDPSLQIVIDGVLKRHIKATGAAKIAEIVESFRQRKAAPEAQRLLDFGCKILGDPEELLQLHSPPQKLLT